MDTLEEIEVLRSELAEIDEEIMNLLGERNSVAKRIGLMKKRSGKEIRVPEVEEAVILRYREAGVKNGVREETAENLAKAIIAESVFVQENSQEK